MLRVLVITCGLAASARAEPGWFVAAGAGLDTTHPFGELQLGHHFRPPFELYLDYSYDSQTIQAFGVGARTYFFHVGTLRIFHQALLADAVAHSSSSYLVEQGLGLDFELLPGWSIKAAASTGFPVHLRSEVGLTFRW
jgi:hypothetical protein